VNKVAVTVLITNKRLHILSKCEVQSYQKKTQKLPPHKPVYIV